MPFFKKSTPKKSKYLERKEQAAERNRKAKERFDEALKRMKPMQEIGDFLGDA